MLKNVPTIGGGQATRTWVSGVGDDANPCSRTAPCKTFAGAISKTALGGEIDALDPGGFGAVTITKGITIDGNGSFASVLAAGVTGITINAGANDVVTLRNLSINGGGTGLDGIHFNSGAALHIENCVIFRFARKGVFFEPSGTSRLSITNSIIRNCNDPANGGGVLVQPKPTGTCSCNFDNVHLENNLFGVTAADNSVITIRNSLITGNSSVGVAAKSTTILAVINLESCTVVENNVTAASIGISATGANAAVRLSNVAVMNNGVGVSSVTGGFIVTYGRNRIAHIITTNGAPNLVEPEV